MYDGSSRINVQKKMKNKNINIFIDPGTQFTGNEKFTHMQYKKVFKNQAEMNFTPPRP